MVWSFRTTDSDESKVCCLCQSLSCFLNLNALFQYWEYSLCRNVDWCYFQKVQICLAQMSQVNCSFMKIVIHGGFIFLLSLFVAKWCVFYILLIKWWRDSKMVWCIRLTHIITRLCLMDITKPFCKFDQFMFKHCLLLFYWNGILRRLRGCELPNLLTWGLDFWNFWCIRFF